VGKYSEREDTAEALAPREWERHTNNIGAVIVRCVDLRAASLGVANCRGGQALPKRVEDLSVGPGPAKLAVGRLSLNGHWSAQSSHR
jgi:hypothetical protein